MSETVGGEGFSGLETQASPTGLRMEAPASSDLISVNPSDLQQALSAASALVERVKWAERLGLASFDGKRDLYAALGYKRTLTLQDYRERYERGGIAKRIVEFLPKLAWSGEVAFQEVEEPEVTTEFEEDSSELLTMDGLDVQKSLQNADILAGLGYYSVILIGAPGELSTELPRLNGPESLLYLTSLSQEQATILSLDTNRTSRRFGLANTYRLDLGKIPNDIQSGMFVPDMSQTDVHWSRIIHVTKGSLSSRIYGEPILRPIWNDLDNLYKLIGGGAETAWNIMSLPTLFNIDKDIQFKEGQLNEFKESIEKLRHKLEPYAYSRGVDAQVIGNKSGLPNFAPGAEAVMDQIAGTVGYPKRVLLGTEEAHQASTQDKNRTDARKDEHIRDCAEPSLRQLTNRMIQYGGVRPLRKESKGKYKVIWAREEEMTETEKTAAIGSIAAANKDQKQAGDTIIMTSGEIRDRIFGLDPLPESKPVDKVVVSDPPADVSDPNVNTNVEPIGIADIKLVKDTPTSKKVAAA